MAVAGPDPGVSEGREAPGEGQGCAGAPGQGSRWPPLPNTKGLQRICLEAGVTLSRVFTYPPKLPNYA